MKTASGKDCMEPFVKELQGRRGNAVYCAYGGTNSNQYHILLKQLIKHKVKHRRTIKNGVIHVLEWQGGHIWDLERFTQASLHKMSGLKPYDFSQIKTWEDVASIQWEQHLEQEVKSCFELFKKVTEKFETKYEVSPSNYVSLSHISYQIWSGKTLKHQVSNMFDKETSDMFGRAIYVGRIQPFQKFFASEMSEEIF